MATTKTVRRPYQYAHLDEALAKLEREFKSAKGVERETVKRWMLLVLEAMIKQPGNTVH